MLEPNYLFYYFANGLTVSNFLLLFREPLFFVQLKWSFIIKTRFISTVFANLMLPHQISTRGKIDNAVERLTKQHAFAIAN